MDITWLGHSSFRLKGKTTSVVTDPFDSNMVGMNLPWVESDIVTVSHAHSDHDNSQAVKGSPKIVEGPGEYEIKGVSIFGIPTFHDSQKGTLRGRNTVYVITMDSITVCHLGDLGHILSEEEVGQVGKVDILLIPTGGVYTIDSRQAHNVVASFEPAVVIPMHYKTADLKGQGFASLEGVEEFIKEMGLDPVRQDKYSVTYLNLPEETQLVILERKS